MTDALDNLLKAAKAVARHEQAYRQCARPERWPIMMPVGELLDLSDAVAAMEAAPAGAPALGEVEREATAQAIMRAAGGDAVVCSIAYKLADAAIAALRHPQAPASGEVALKAADKLIAMHRDYTTMPYPDFHAKHGSVDATVLFARVRAEYVEARSTSSSQPASG